MLDFVAMGSCGRPALHRHLRPQAVAGTTSIDLTRLTFCEPLGLVAIAAFADRMVQTQDVVLRGPGDLSVARYLARMRLDRVLHDLGVDHDLPAVREHELDDVLVELRRFEGSRDVDDVAGMVHRAALQVDGSVAAALHDGIAEVGDNVPLHSRRAHGYIAAQKMAKGRELLFAVGDAGVGMLETLRPSGARSHAGALELAITEGVTESPGENAGTGLSQIVEHVSALAGNLHLVSGDAALTVSRTGRRKATAPTAFPGTVVQGLVARPQ